MSILNDSAMRHNPLTEAELSDGWNLPDGDPWDDDSSDEPIDWLPTDSWFDRQAEIYEAKGTDLGNHVAAWLRAEAKAMRALDASTLSDYLARAETYGI